MARPSAHTPARRLLLQVVLLLILIGTVGLAKVVTRYKLRAAEVRLTPPVKFDDMGVPLPERWAVEVPRVGGGGGGAMGPRVIRATEPAGSDRMPGRILTVIRDHTEMPQPPAEYLFTSGIMPAAYAPQLGGVGRLAKPAATPVAGDEDGYLVAGVRPIRLNTGAVVPQKEVFATAMLPSRDVVTVKLIGLGQDVTDDLALVRKIAAGISVPSSSAAAAAGDKVTLGNGCTVKVPPGFDVLPEPDAHLTERHLVRAASPSRWCGVTLVPCVYFPGSDDLETFRTMLTSRDAEWLDARVAGEATKGVLRADLPLRAGLPFPRRAYLLTSPTGDALMVELHAGSAEDVAVWDAVLKQVAQSATPAAAAAAAGPSPVELLKVGVAEVERLRRQGLPSALAGVPADQWWLWTMRGRPAGWTHLTFDVGDPSHGLLDSRLRVAGGATVVLRHAFETSPDLSRHNDSTVQTDLTPTNDRVDKFKEQTAVADGKITLGLMPDPASGRVARGVRPVPDAFLPGPWIPLLAPWLERKEMIVRTTRLPGLESVAATAPLTVRLRPTSRPAEFDVDVSGTGQVLTLSPGGMEMSETVARYPTNPEEIKKTFPDDAALSPEPGAKVGR